MALMGSQVPRIFCGPISTGDTSRGEAAIELAASVGLILDPWQRLVLKAACMVRDDRLWAAFEVACIVSRQNGKGSILEARQLAGLFLFGESLQLYSSHEFKTSVEAFRRVRDHIVNSSALTRRTAKIPTSHGDEGIELYTGQRLRFIARSSGSGRGFSPDVVYWDEAFNLPSSAVAALLPALSARKNPQLWYTSSAGWEISTALAAVRNRGLAGGSERLAYAEWSIDETPYDLTTTAGWMEMISDRNNWALANPGLGIRITEDFVAAEIEAMKSEPELFARERLGVGQWPISADSWSVIGEAIWRELIDPLASTAGRPVALAVDITPDQGAASIGCCGVDAFGHEVIDVVDHRPGTSWVIDRLVELVRKHKPIALVICPRAPAGAILEELETALERMHQEKILLLPSSVSEAQACQAFYNSAVDSAIIRHRGQESLSKALAGARQKVLGEGAWTWNRRAMTVDISPLWSVTLARWGFHAAPVPTKSFAFFE